MRKRPLNIKNLSAVVICGLFLSFFLSGFCNEFDPGDIILKNRTLSFSDDSLECRISLIIGDKLKNHLYMEVLCNGESISNSIRFLPYPVYTFFLADADNNGKMDIAVGVIKKTRTDPDRIGRRPFFFQIKNNIIAPLWLGTTFGMPLIKFKPAISGKTTLIKTLMKERGGRYCTALYKWRRFGFAFQKFLFQNMTIDEALNKFEEN